MLGKGGIAVKFGGPCSGPANMASSATNGPFSDDWKKLVRLESTDLAPVEFSPGTVLHLDKLANEPFAAAVRYRASRDAHIVSDPETLGGTPVIRGTRITVYSVLGRLQDGDSVDDLVSDNPDVPREAFEAAAVFARAHPLRGRPGGRPWRDATGRDS